MGVQQARNLPHRRAHAGHVRGCRERTDAQATLILRCAQQLRQVREIHAPVGRKPYGDDSGKALPPGHLVGVMLVGTDEHDRLVCLLEPAEFLEPRLAEELPQLLIEHRARGGRQRDAEDLLQLVDRAGGAGATGHDPSLRARVHRALDHALGLVQQVAHAATGDVVLRVGVGVDPLQALQVALDENQAAPGRRVVAVDHEPAAERRVECRIDAHDLAAQEFEIPLVHAGIVREKVPVLRFRKRPDSARRDSRYWPLGVRSWPAEQGVVPRVGLGDLLRVIGVRLPKEC